MCLGAVLITAGRIDGNLSELVTGFRVSGKHVFHRVQIPWSHEDSALSRIKAEIAEWDYPNTLRISGENIHEFSSRPRHQFRYLEVCRNIQQPAGYDLPPHPESP